MKNIIYLFVFSFLLVQAAIGQNLLPEPVQTWMAGSGLRNTPAVYGEKGVSNSKANPGSRSDFAYWTDLQGNFWVFGGFGYGEYDETDETVEPGILGDLWKFDRNSQNWIWMGGSKRFDLGYTDETELNASYGEIGVSSASNWPSATRQMAFTVGEDGNLYMFGGDGYQSGILNSRLNELWKYDVITNQWTFLYGKMTYNNDPGIYGIKNVESESNYIPARLKPGMWTDSDNNIYIFGGYGNVETTIGYTNDLWKYNASTGLWTWIGGSKLSDQGGEYGTQGTASINNIPPAKWSFAYGKVGTNEVHLFGGQGSSNNLYNDLWKYDISNNRWTWLEGSNTPNDRTIVHGELGVGSIENSVDARSEMAFATDYPNADNPSLYIFGGNYFLNFQYNDLWKYDKVNGYWIWIGGSAELQLNSRDFEGEFGTLNAYSAENNIPHRSNALLSIGGNEANVFGGRRRRLNQDKHLNDLWTINLSNFQAKWINGDSTVNKSGHYGPLKVDVSTVSPGARARFGFTADANNDLWLYGGLGFSQVSFNQLADLWKYDRATESWLWVDGTDEINVSGDYVEFLTPGSRADHIFEGDSKNNLWLLGGYGLSANHYLNDVWKYEISAQKWSLLKGDGTVGQAPVYGEKGIGNAANTPGARRDYASAIDENDDIWLFGGTNQGSSEQKNDLWKFDTQKLQWIWVSGVSEGVAKAVFGNLGEASENFTPGGRSGATMSIRGSRLFIFGGTNGNNLNDLWIYNIAKNTWAWHYGDVNPENASQQDERAVRGVESNENLIGTRLNATAVIDENGHFWTFATTAGFALNNTFWKFNPANGLWTWMAGGERTRSYGMKGVVSKLNQFPQRDGGKALLIQDQVYYYGGRDGFDRANQRGYMDDLWRFDLLLRNNAPTDLLLSQQTVLENADAGVLVGQLTGIDEDENELLSYELVAGEGDTNNKDFYIAENVLYAAKSFNFEEDPELSVRVRVIDKGGLFFEKLFSIAVIDQPDAPTDLLIDTQEVTENLPVNSIISNISVIDEDANEQFTFELVEGSGATHNDKFAIINGQLATAVVFDFEAIKNPLLSIRVEVSDKDGLKFQKAFTITVTDVNDNPSDILLSNTSIAENEGENALIGDLTAIDQDEGDEHSFKILESQTNQDHLKFIVVDNELRTSEILNFEEQATYRLTLRATDLAGGFLDVNFEITVEDIAESPTDLILSKNTIEEGAQIGTLIGNLLVEDDDLDETHIFSFIGGEGSSDNQRFNIVDDQLFSAEVFDFETANVFSIRIRVIDKDGLSLDKILSVKVLNVNEAPTAVELSNKSIMENSPLGSLVGIVSNNDPDLNDSYTYQLVDSENFPDNAYFNIVENRLETLEIFDFESDIYDSKFSINIQVTDAEGLSHTQDFEIDLLDENEAPTDLTLSISEIEENVAEGTVVGLLSTADEDSNENHRYEWVDLSAYPDNDNFTIEGNQLILAISPNYEVQTSHEIKIRVSDKGGLSYDTTLVIAILDVNEVPIDIELSKYQIAENQPPSSVVGLLSVVDEDFNDAHTLTFEQGSGSADNSFFTIEDKQLLTKESFDFEDPAHGPSYSVRIKATDAEGLTFTKIFNIEILDEMEAPSAILLSNLSIGEALPPSTLVGVLQTVDSDDPNETDLYTYEIIPQSGATDHNFFRVEGDELLSAETLFFASQSSFQLMLQTTDPDGLTFQQMFDIEVIPIVDDQAPSIENMQLPTNSVYLKQSNQGEISFTVSDNYWVNEVQLFHKQLNESQFSVVDFDVVQGGSYNLPLKDELMGIAGIMFYVQAIDSVNNISRTANQYVYVRYADDEVPTLGNLGSGGELNDYRMFSIPFDLEDSRVDNIFAPTFGAYNQEVWRLFHFDNGQYLEFQAGLTNIDKGKGYWFNSRRVAELNLSNVRFPAYTHEAPFQMTLRQGWNQIGNPYNFEIDWNTVISQNEGGDKVSDLKVFRGEGYVDETKLQAFEGAFVFAETATVLNIPMVNEQNATRISSQSPPELDWVVDFSLEMDDKKSNPLQIGMLEVNQPAKKMPATPKFIEYFELASMHSDLFWKTYTKDLVEFKNEHRWEIEISQNIVENNLATLKWATASAFSDGQLMLIDEDSKRVIDMSLHSEYKFNSSFQKKFKVIYNTNGVRDFDFFQSHVGNVFPNPMRDYGFLSIVLPENAEKYRVELKIFDINGKQIGTDLLYNLEYGAHQLPLNPSDLPAGMYLYRLIIDGGQREIFNGKFSKL